LDFRLGSQNVGLPPAYLLLRFVAFFFYFSGKPSGINDFFRGDWIFRWAASGIYKNYYWFSQTIIEGHSHSGIKNPFRFNLKAKISEMVKQNKEDSAQRRSETGKLPAIYCNA
jgi:hypothetical protein